MTATEEAAFLKEVYLRRYRSKKTRNTVIILFFYVILYPLIYFSDKLWDIG